MVKKVKAGLLDSINVPSDVRKLPESDLSQLSEELRLEIEKDHPHNVVAKIVAHQVDADSGELHLKCRWRGFTAKLDS